LRILFVGMPDSVHTARWINQVSELGWDLHLFSSNSGAPHKDLRNVTVYNISFARPDVLHKSVRLKGLWPSRIGVERLSLKISYAKWLARVVRRIRPDIVHSMEIQRAGYITAAARAQFEGDFPPWIVSNWGSDIYLFGRLAAHKERIEQIMASCDYYHCECHRDARLALEYGFRGEVLPIFPVTGGFDIERKRRFCQPGLTSSRRVVALKGYQNWAGRALVGLRAIELCGDQLRNYRIVVYMAGYDVKIAAELVALSTGLNMDFETKDWTRDDILRMHGQARISIGLSISDAISTSLLEAMIMGSFPVQSNTGCGDEWLVDGETGLLVPPNDPEPVAAAIRAALADDQLVDNAAARNLQLANLRLDTSVIKPKVIEMYQMINEGRTNIEKHSAKE